MTKDKVTEILVEALRQALETGREQPVIKSGKLPGLFPGKSGANGEAVSRAFQEAFLEITRTEAKGKTSIQWARITPAGVNFLHDHDSPVRALRDLQEVLQTAQGSIPVWLADLERELQELTGRLTAEAQLWTQRLETLSERVTEALRRAELGTTRSSNGVLALVPWAPDALDYLDRRQAGVGREECPFPELFAALREKHDDLSMTAFHNGLRVLSDGRAVQLLPFTGSGELPQPEYALLDGPQVLYYVSR
jgi:hypothetical protein